MAPSYTSSAILSVDVVCRGKLEGELNWRKKGKTDLRGAGSFKFSIAVNFFFLHFLPSPCFSTRGRRVAIGAILSLTPREETRADSTENRISHKVTTGK